MEQINTLGFTINPNIEDLSSNYDKPIEKIIRHLEFWENFGLTIYGRANVVRTYGLSQLTHYLPVIHLRPDQIVRIDNLFVNFIKKRGHYLKR